MNDLDAPERLGAHAGAVCAECGLDEFHALQISSRLRRLSSAWTTLLEAPGAAIHPGHGVWAPVEHGCHVRDLLVLFRYRLRLTLRNNEPLYSTWSDDDAVVRDRYREQDARRVAREIVAAGARLADDFEVLGPIELERGGYRRDGERFTVEDLGRYVVHELAHHLAEATKICDPVTAPCDSGGGAS